MSRVQRLEQVAKLTAEREKKAAEALAASAKRLEEAKARLDTLYRFRSEYLLYLQPSEVAMSAIWLQQLRAFLSNLSGAIEEQEAALQKLRQEHAALQSAWQKAHCRHRGIEKVQADFLRRQQLTAERRLQRELDDRAGRRRLSKDGSETK